MFKVFLCKLLNRIRMSIIIRLDNHDILKPHTYFLVFRRIHGNNWSPKFLFHSKTVTSKSHSQKHTLKLETSFLINYDFCWQPFSNRTIKKRNKIARAWLNNPLKSVNPTFFISCRSHNLFKQQLFYYLLS